MTESPLVTVLTTCFNHEAYLPACLDSLIAQTYPRIELVLVDDCSSDGSWDVVEQYRRPLEERCERLVLLRQSENRGLLPTFRRAAGEASGAVLSILESDDLYYPRKLERNVEALASRPDVGAIHSDADEIREDLGLTLPGLWSRSGREIPTGRVFEDLLWDNFVLNCTFACRIETFRTAVRLSVYVERGYPTVDYPMFLDLSRQTEFGYIDEPLAVYRRVPDSVSHSTDVTKGLRWRLGYYRIKREFCREFGAPAELTERAERQYQRYRLRYGWSTGSRDAFDDAFDRLMAIDPERYRKLAMRMRRASIRSRALWRLVSGVERLLGGSDLSTYSTFRDEAPRTENAAHG